MPFGDGGWNPGFKQAKLGSFHAANFIAQSCRFLKFKIGRSGFHIGFKISKHGFEIAADQIA
jgi:hypothetical protein